MWVSCRGVLWRGDVLWRCHLKGECHVEVFSEGVRCHVEVSAEMTDPKFLSLLKTWLTLFLKKYFFNQSVSGSIWIRIHLDQDPSGSSYYIINIDCLLREQRFGSIWLHNIKSPLFQQKTSFWLKRLLLGIKLPSCKYAKKCCCYLPRSVLIKCISSPI